MTWAVKEFTTERRDAERKFILLSKGGKDQSIQGWEERVACTFEEQAVAVAKQQGREGNCVEVAQIPGGCLEKLQYVYFPGDSGSGKCPKEVFLSASSSKPVKHV